ncbi:MAG: 1-acyl-sn-glycerol-3-phosphate acyltransferase [Lachnospiraceae bacterium]|nr:1-acyl-sn-glycerol-3-phosphate acyltransferase [Lachnospiraceae bacterium]
MKVNFRSVLCVLYVAWYLIFFLPLHLVLWLIGKKKPMTKYRVSHKMIRWAFNCVLWLGGVKKNVVGVENIPTDTPVLFVSNHRSYLDILLLQTTAGVPVGFVAKKELRQIPLLGLWMSDIGCVFLDRANIKASIKSIADATEHIKCGCSMSICPEGTRGHTDEMKEFKDGSLKMATKANVPVVPVAILGTDDCLENNEGFKITKGTITIAYGKPIILSELETEQKKHLGGYTQTFVKELYENNKAEHMALNQKN